MMLPTFFKPLLWSYRFSDIDSNKNKKIIIVNTINYGNLSHWRWITRRYGRETIQEILVSIPASELRLRAKKLASLLFSITTFNNAPRGPKRTR